MKFGSICDCSEGVHDSLEWTVEPKYKVCDIKEWRLQCKCAPKCDPEYVNCDEKKVSKSLYMCLW